MSLALAALPARRLPADGNETIGPPPESFPLVFANVIVAGGVGLAEKQPMTAVLDVPEGVEIEQIILYWGTRSSTGDAEAVLDGSIQVTGTLIGTSPGFGDSQPRVYRADITELGLIQTGRNEVAISGLQASGEDAIVDGAGIVVLGNDGGSGQVRVLDGCDFAYWNAEPPIQNTVRQKFTFDEASFERDALLVLIVADHTPPEQGQPHRPSTLEVTAGGTTTVVDNPLSGSEGSSWDTISIPVAIPAGSTQVEAQLFSDSRAGNRLSPSSFYWLFGALRVPEELTISGVVYFDDNGNGDRDEGESGIPGVEVTFSCTHGDEMVKGSVITGEDGSYRIEGVPPGADCVVSVVPSPALNEREPTEVCPPHMNIRANVTDCDFGFAAQPVVGDTVFLDENGDGAQQQGEPGLAGVVVSIVSPAGPGFAGFEDTETTDSDGKYLFRIPGVPAGAMLVSTVSIDPESGAARGKTLTTPNPQQTIPLGPGGSDLARDFGLEVSTGDARVGDTVFSDLDGDGAEDPEEPGLAGVEVSIECPVLDGFAGFEGEATTDANGKYLFTVPGIPEEVRVVCSVSIDPLSGGAAGKTLTTPNPQETVPLGPGAADLDRDFGLETGEGDALVGDTVYCDVDGDGVQDEGEPGIGEVEVRLEAAEGGGFPGSSQTAMTDVNGKYLFTLQGIPFGTTVVARVSIDAAAQALEGKRLTTPNPQDTPPLGPGTEDRERDFGLQPIAAMVGDTVFLDVSGNGVQEAGEPGLSGVAVRIEAPASGAFGGFSANAVTDSNGKYLFAIEGIPPETPVVAEVSIDPATGMAAGKELTTPNPQQTIPLGPGTSDLNRDFGLRSEDVAVRMCMEEKTVLEGECADVRVLLSSTHPVQGFVTAVKHDPEALSLEAITMAGTATEANMADFTSVETFPDGGTSAAILDLEAPFLGNTIPAGESIPIVVYRYCCRPMPLSAEPRVTPLRFVNGELGDPPRENVVVIAGTSQSPELCDGRITCTPAEDPSGPCFLCGGFELGVNDLPVPVEGGPGDRVEVCLYYCSPEDNLPGHPQFDHLQGLSMAICFDCRLECLEGSFRVPPDTITDALGVEFVSFQCENDQEDGDGCEIIFSLLVDWMAPFDGRTLPPTEVPLKLACFDMRIRENVPCGTCLPIEFCDGINGRGIVPIKNLVAAENKSFPARTMDCTVCVTSPPVFVRGDCNGDSRANLPDAAAMISYLFPRGFPESDFLPGCVDGCDANDDGRVDIADAVRLLGWLFTDEPAPPAPGPDRAGLDPTQDKLDCSPPECPRA